jgi:hypothetical protein
MASHIKPGDCVRIPDGRIGRVRDASKAGYRVRVRRKNSKTHQFLTLAAEELQLAKCPPGWMSPSGYLRYLRITLAKMRQRQAATSAPAKRSKSRGKSIARHPREGDRQRGPE